MRGDDPQLVLPAQPLTARTRKPFENFRAGKNATDLDRFGKLLDGGSGT